MNLTEFLSQLFSTGAVTVPRQMADIDDADRQEAITAIRGVYNIARLEMSHQPPAFDEQAALWAAEYLFHSVQLLLLRELDAGHVDVHLKPYAGDITPAAIFSVDILFRHLAPLFKFGSGISPGDPLVARLKETAGEWPFSSVGLGVCASANTDVIFSYPSLKYAYIDRIIQHRDVARLAGDAELTILKETFGLQQAQLWPGFELLALPTETL